MFQPKNSYKVFCGCNDGLWHIIWGERDVLFCHYSIDLRKNPFAPQAIWGILSVYDRVTLMHSFSVKWTIILHGHQSWLPSETMWSQEVHGLLENKHVASTTVPERDYGIPEVRSSISWEVLLLSDITCPQNAQGCVLDWWRARLSLRLVCIWMDYSWKRDTQD